ncbi:MAG: riboflavin synthase [Phycisphaerae bacterium]|jgi:riboflavin synthase|nr:riboflavin synthase [Phycisphaerae bacterium]MDP7287564.1 riboflavin synthase [Phycisphaerae bacterium]
MFTGIVQHVGSVRAVRNTADGARLSIDIGPLTSDLKRGDSVAVNGACLTASDLSGQIADFDVIAETLKRTTLGAFRPGVKVNLERAMRLSDGLDGHIVQGHVDATATVRRMDRGQPCILELQADRELTALMAPKGSVAINGVSLTLVDISADRFSVGLIPTTLTDSTLGELSAGDTVNIEADIIGKYVVTFLKQMIGQGSGSGAVTLDKLREAGFI